MKIEIVGPEVEARLNWRALTDALIAGHRLPRAQIGDTLLSRGQDKLLSRAAWIEGMGLAVKDATIFPGNGARGLPSINGGVNLYNDETGLLEALVDFGVVTKWKTAGDSLLAARLLARPDSRLIVIAGAGAVARSMVSAYRSAFPEASFVVWSRTIASASRLAAEVPDVVATSDLEGAVRGADIVCTATMSEKPLIKGAWLRAGTHLDLIGAYTPTMREVDDATLRRAHLFVDSRETTLDHVGEMLIPLRSGVIERKDIRGDFYDIAAGAFTRRDPDEVTLCKNGGGAHLDLMTARFLLEAWRKR
jgi:ornithine cyclodeaminase